MPRIKLTDLDIERSVQVRTTINAQTVAEYVEHIESKGPPFPPVIVFGPDLRGKYYISEGWHRVEAHRKAERDSIAATVRDGGWKEALENALGSNAHHGLRRSNSDKRHAVTLALKHWSVWSDQLIADKCAVSRDFVGNVRRASQVVVESEPVAKIIDETTCGRPQVDASRVVTGKDGKKHVIRPLPTRPAPKQATDMEEVTTTGTPSFPTVQDSDIAPPAAPTVGRSKEADAQGLEMDARGRPIPPDLSGLWGRRSEVKAILDQLSRVKAAMQRAQEDRDPLWCGAGQGQSPVNFSAATAHLQQARAAIAEAMPWAVCPSCQGTGCRCCSGLGLISKFRYDTIIPAKLKGTQS